MATTPPEWFKAAVATPYEDHYEDVPSVDLPHDVCRIHYQLFRPSSAALSPRLVVLVHGGGAHSRWWDWTAPYLAADGHLVACIDLSGQGDSGRREQYSMGTNAAEVMAIADSLVTSGQCRRRPYIVGHSFGGWVALLCARQHGSRLGGCITLDSPVRHPDTPLMPPPLRSKKKGDASKEAMLARFRLMPPQPVSHAYLIDYVGPLSLTFQTTVDHEDEGGLMVAEQAWVWKDDAERMLKTRFMGVGWESDMSQRLKGLVCKLAVVYGERSCMFSDPLTLPYMRGQLDLHRPGGEVHTPMIAIPDAFHHLMFDQPLAVVSTLRAVLGEWERAACAAAAAEAAPGEEGASVAKGATFGVGTKQGADDLLLADTQSAAATPTSKL
jgi:pimeloyl-ACP methyl ester carboxylesterase